MTKKFSLVLILLVFICFALSGCGLFESEESYKKNAIALDNYQEFSRQPDNYKDKKLLITQRISNINQNGNKVELITTPYKSDPFVIHYEMKDGERQMQTNDVVRIWGTFEQISSKKLVDFLPAGKVIEIDAKYIAQPAWGFIDSPAGQISLHGNTEQNQPLKLAMSLKKINQDSLAWDGYIMFNSEFFYIQGNINDTGDGTFKYVDSNGNASGATGTLKIIGKKSIELQTEQTALQVSKGYAQFGKPADLVTITFPAGTYTFK